MSMWQGEYAETLKQQGGGCAICGKPEFTSKWVKRLCVYRKGLVCSECREGLILFENNAVFLAKAVLYLEKANG